MEMRRLVDSYNSDVNEEETNAGDERISKCGSESGITFSPNGCFDCNICLEFAADPVVTLCGHLYCWPCIYKWLHQSSHVHSSSQQCPVCKVTLSQEALVPLYGRGIDSNKSEKGDHDIPHRPSVQRELIDYLSTSETEEQYHSFQSQYPQIHHNHQQEHPYVNAGSDYMLPSSPLGTIGVFHSTAGGFLAGMAVDFLPLIFRNQQFSDMYYSSPYYTAGNGGSPRLRRQELKFQQTLHQIWAFLSCCAILCLLLF